MRALALLLAALALPDSAFARGTASQTSPTRVSVLLPYVEDALAQVAGPFVVVAAVRRSLHAPVATGIADLGNPHAPSFERLAEASPDLVIGDRTIHGALSDRLGTSGASVLLIDDTSIDATFAGLDEVGRRVGAGDAMAEATQAARASLAGLALERPVRVLAVFGAPGSFLVVSERTWLGDLLKTLGFVNVGAVEGADERLPGLVALSDEAMASLRPELVLLVAHGDPAALEAALSARLSGGGPWNAVGRGAARGIHALDARLFAANPGLELPRAARALAQLANGSPPTAAAAERP